MFPINVLSGADFGFRFWPKADPGRVRIAITTGTKIKNLSEFVLISSSVKSIDFQCKLVVRRFVAPVACVSISSSLSSYRERKLTTSCWAVVGNLRLPLTSDFDVRLPTINARCFCGRKGRSVIHL